MAIIYSGNARNPCAYGPPPPEGEGNTRQRTCPLGGLRGDPSDATQTFLGTFFGNAKKYCTLRNIVCYAPPDGASTMDPGASP